MKNITSVDQIDFSIPTQKLASIPEVYVLPKGVLVSLLKYINGKADIQVTNANYIGDNFIGKSFGGLYQPISWCLEHLPYWIEQSQGDY